MISDLNLEINELKEKINRKKYLRGVLDKLKRNLITEEEQLNNLESQLKKENLDVENLKKMSLTSLFYTLLGRREEKIDKETQEALAAQFRYDSSIRTVKEIEEHILKVNNELSQYHGCENDLEDVLEEKKNLILKSNNPNAKKIIVLIDDEGEIFSIIKELKEAISAGTNVYNSLDATIKSLENAENLGTLDRFGGVFLSDGSKHGYIDDANHQAQTTKRLLRKFNAELSDVCNVYAKDIQIGSFTTFADFFFDGIISDYIVQPKISESLEHTIQNKNEISTILNRLNNRLNIENEKLLNVGNNLKTLIEEA